MKKTVYLAVTPDKYQLPLYVADSVGEMAERFNTTVSSVSTSISKNKSGNRKGVKFIRIEIKVDEVTDE
ncbi:hypothetical protein ABID14_000365 [Peptoniphilus olsenii]|uniref:Uncharacterized protein n=1 Tax=Peptoniphilus olsenii TaxID=411570 RepID=A0ABV2JA18_9FIRM